jgi:hypothetical protein
MDSNGDLAAVAGDFALVGGDTAAANQAAVAQGIKIRVRMILGEYYLDEEVGVDWLGQILVKNPDPAVVRELIRQAIASTPDVLEVVGADLQLDTETRTGSIPYSVITAYSTTALVGEVTSP